MKIAVINFFGTTPDVPGATKHYELSCFFQNKKNMQVEFWMNGVNYATDRPVSGINSKKICCYKTENSGLLLVYFKGIRHRNKKVFRELGMLLFSLLTAGKLLFSKDIDAVILSMPPVTNLVAVVAHIKKIVLIADVEDLWPLFLEESGIKNKAILKYYDIQAKSIYKNADGIDAVSNGMLSYVQGIIDCSKKHCWLAPLGVNLEVYDSIKIKADLSQYKWINDFKIMYIGAHGLANDISSVMKVASKFENITIDGKKVSFVFIGDGNYKHVLLKQLKEQNLNNFYFEDAISSNLVPYYLSQADVCLTNLRRLECFKLVRPNKLFQYMAAKKPIICGIWGEAADIILEAKCGINVDFTNIEDAVNNINRFIHRNDLKELGMRGNLYIRKNGNRSLIYEEFYRRTIEIIKNKKG